MSRRGSVASPVARDAGGGRIITSVEGEHLGTHEADARGRRVKAHGLGRRVATTVHVAETGVLLTGVGDAGELWVPRADLRGARRSTATGRRPKPEDDVVVLTWRLGDLEVETGVRPADRTRCDALLDAVTAVAAGAADATSAPSLLATPFPGAPTSDHAPAEAPAADAPPVSAALRRLAATTRLATPRADLPARPAPAPVPTGSAAAVQGSGTPEPAAAVALAEAASGPAPQPRRTGAVPASGVAHLVLEDGRTFTGRAFGAAGTTTGEAVFCTGMTGYQETLTDPSYAGQVVVQSAPHIGNTGANDVDPESSRMWVAGYVVRDPSPMASSWRSERTLEVELAEQGVVGISGIDTRALVRHLRDHGAMRCAIGSELGRLHDLVRAAPAMTGLELASTVSTAEPYVVAAQGRTVARVAALDLGIKGRTPWHLAQLGVEVHVLPARTPAADLLAMSPDGVFLSNGPGDPAATTYAHETLREVLAAAVPVFGICLGNQVLGHALGLTTRKLPFGHRGLNHPVLDVATGRVVITSQNHGFAVEAPREEPFDTPYGAAEVSHTSLFDDSVEGLRCLDRPAFSVQFHPEAAAGPHDAAPLFEEFVTVMTTPRSRIRARR